MMRIPQAVLLAALERAETTCDNPGFCLDCGKGQEGCEPDARNYECESCGNMMVFGAAEVLLMGEFS